MVFTATAGDGCPISASLAIEVEDCSNSIEENIAEAFTIVSSAESTSIAYSNNATFECTLITMDGKQVLNATGNQQLTLAHSNLASGIYLLRIEAEGKFLNKKLWIRGE